MSHSCACKPITNCEITALPIYNRFSSEAHNDATAAMAVASALSACGQYERAEQLFDRAGALARVGAGIYFLPPSAMISFDGTGQFAGFRSTTTWNATTQSGFLPLNFVSNPFPNCVSTPTGSSQGLLTLIGNGPSQVWPKAPHPTPYTEQWSFDLQYQLTAHSVFQIGYLGNWGASCCMAIPT
jgi:hypothetical protein